MRCAFFLAWHALSLQRLSRQLPASRLCCEEQQLSYQLSTTPSSPCGRPRPDFLAQTIKFEMTGVLCVLQLLEPTAGIMNCTGEEHQPISHAFFLPLLAFAVESMVLCQDAVNGLQVCAAVTWKDAGLHKGRSSASSLVQHSVRSPSVIVHVTSLLLMESCRKMQHIPVCCSCLNRWWGSEHCTGQEQQSSQQAILSACLNHIPASLHGALKMQCTASNMCCSYLDRWLGSSTAQGMSSSQASKPPGCLPLLAAPTSPAERALCWMPL